MTAPVGVDGSVRQFLPESAIPESVFAKAVKSFFIKPMSETVAKPRLLIVDDEAEVRSVLHDLLSGPYQCGEAASAEDAIAELREEGVL